MKTIFKITGVIAFVFVMDACKTTSNMHNSSSSLDWEGVYKGSVTSEGKETVMVLSLYNGLYSLQTAVTNEPDKLIESKGSFSWNKSGNEITLKESGRSRTFKVGENILREIGKSAPLYTLDKIQKETVVEKYWKLIEINGNPVAIDKSMAREPFIILKNDDSRVNANGGCNMLMGTFEIGPMNRIKFSQMISTMMACPDMKIETELKTVLETVDNYTLSNDGKYLSLNRARMAPLARFEVVYLR